MVDENINLVRHRSIELQNHSLTTTVFVSMNSEEGVFYFKNRTKWCESGGNMDLWFTAFSLKRTLHGLQLDF